MNTNMILKTDILDIIFEKRNKAYGAYELRKFYPDRLKLALGFMLFISIAFSAFTLWQKKETAVIARPYDIPVQELVKIEIPVKEPEKKQELSKPESKITPVNQTKYTNNIKVVSKTEKTDTIKTILASTVIGTTNIDNAKPGIVLVEPDKPAVGNGGPEKAKPEIDINTPMDINTVDVQPAFPGGLDGLKKFLEKNLQNPYDLENGETVNVKVRFVVGYNGKLQGFTTIQDGGEVYNKEVVRVLKKMPEWQPGKANGQNVSVYYTIPVKFVMSN